MACMVHRARAGRRRAAVPLGLLAVALALGGCASGDFGRTRADMRSDDMHRWVGEEATASVGITPSQFQLTDDERQLRDYAYPFIEPPHTRPEWKGVFGDYTPFPAPWRREAHFDRTAYGRLLIDEPHRSHSSRYAQLMEDVRDDLTRIEPFFQVATHVLDMDSRRNQGRAIVSDLSPRENDDAKARMAENAMVIKWVQHCLKQRAASYRWALERLVIQAPDPMVADADRLIALLEAEAAPRVASGAGVAVVSKG
jgi:hypothetical protein